MKRVLVIWSCILLTLAWAGVGFAQDTPSEPPVAAAVRDGMLVLIDAAGGELALDNGPYGAVESVTWSLDGERLAVVALDGDFASQLWIVDVQMMERRPLDVGPLEYGFAPTFTPDGQLIYAAADADVTADEGYRVRVNVVAPEVGAEPQLLGAFDFVRACGGGSPLPADWQSWRENSGFGGGSIVLAWTASGILHSLSCSGEGLGLLDPQSGEDRVLIPVGDSRSQPEAHVNQARLSNDGQVAAIKSTYMNDAWTHNLVLIDLATDAVTDLATAAEPRQLAWADDGSLFYSTRVAEGNLMDALSADERRAFEEAMGGTGMSVTAWEAAVRQINPTTGEDDVVTRANAYDVGRLEAAGDGSLWFSQVANLDGWVEAIAVGSLEPQSATEAEQLALVPVSVYRLDLSVADTAERMGYDLHRFALRPGVWLPEPSCRPCTPRY